MSIMIIKPLMVFNRKNTPESLPILRTMRYN